MTVSYSLVAATANALTFWKLMLWWKGSIWKLVICEIFVWLICAIVLMLFAHFWIIDSYMEQPFKSFVKFMVTMDFGTPLGFLLGFTIPFCFQRWSAMYEAIHWPDNFAHTFNAYLEESPLPPNELQKMRRTIARYIILAYILLFRDVSVRTRKRFPTVEHLTRTGGIMTKAERELLGSGRISESNCHYWVPIMWICAIVKKRYRCPIPLYRMEYSVHHYIFLELLFRPASEQISLLIDSKATGTGKHGKKNHREKKTPKPSIMSEKQYLDFILTISKLRGDLGDILSYDWVPMPLAQLQTIVLAISFYSMCLWLHAMEAGVEDRNFFTIRSILNLFLNTFFLLLYFGWVKSFEVIVNPFGEDDDDFEVDWLIDRHWQMLSRVLCEPTVDPPRVSSAIRMGELPHTIASCALMNRQAQGPTGSLANKNPDNAEEMIVVNSFLDPYYVTEGV